MVILVVVVCTVYVQTVQYLQGVALHSLQCLNFTPGTELRHTRWRNRVGKRSLRAEGPNTTEHSEGHGEGKDGDMLPHQRDKPYLINKSSVKQISVLLIWLRFLLLLVCLAFSNIFLLKVKLGLQ
jgi:hypothetical protein